MQCVIFIGEREYEIKQGNEGCVRVQELDSKEAIVRCGST
jgi:hypothetical protein